MLATLLVALVAIIHLAILVLEMFLWEAPAGRRAFNLSADFARQTRVLAANQGLYNGFLAAGLAWGLWLGAPGVQVVIFFLACVLAAGIFGALTAGIFGALTASRKILYIQALPALLALVAVLTQA
ncbi:TPA: DUF1304 domain-containing protein [Klebsiella pneumoniae]|uniref:DUF1304 domain-containing protein n=18 Tax=Enterobacteriaceae TaxID=543 RepID=UPI001C663263|nr:DUF1304 domain-containing protein [Klebsiella pneumoniae]MBW6021917.1 hypothetical protein [Klebsiella pneumoniae]MDF1913465.1 DUF1304 domain-containing protein [Klebsiella pneumoniae]HDH0401456.1 DUF1304 domain-containing protein [Klebsiella pneumoniae]